MVNTCQERLLELFVTKLASICSSIDVIQVLDGSKEQFFNLAKVNTVPCMFSTTPSLRLRVED